MPGIASTLFTILGWTRKVHADADYFSGTDYIGKTRKGLFKNFYVNYFKPMRRVNAESWKLKVEGLCESPQSFTLDELYALPQSAQVSRLKCVECWSAKAKWGGFHFSELEQLVSPKAEASGVVFHCADTYLEFLPLADLRHSRTLMATHMDGEPLNDGHGFPLRVVIPYKYGYKNPKAILKIEFVRQPQSGTWSKIGPYSTDGTILPGYDHPLDRGKRRRQIDGGEIMD